MALQREACFPVSVLGPVLLRELRRLASICLKEVIVRLQKLASFCDSGPDRSVDRVLPCFDHCRSPSVVDDFATTGHGREGSDQCPTFSTMPLHRRSGGLL